MTECNSLRNVLEELAQKGLLDKLLKKEGKKFWNVFLKDKENEAKKLKEKGMVKPPRMESRCTFSQLS